MPLPLFPSPVMWPDMLNICNFGFIRSTFFEVKRYLNKVPFLFLTALDKKTTKIHNLKFEFDKKKYSFRCFWDPKGCKKVPI